MVEERAGLSENITNSCQAVLFMVRRALHIFCRVLVSRKVLALVYWALKREVDLNGDLKTDSEAKKKSVLCCTVNMLNIGFPLAYLLFIIPC